MEMVSKVRKGFFRLYRIIRFGHRVYGKVGVNNKFARGCLLLEDAKIGSYNYIGSYTMINNAKIGNYCSIAPGVKIGQANHDITCFSTNSRFCVEKMELYTTPAEIGNDVWVAANAEIMQGVKIGTGAVIGAGAIVTKDVPEYTIAVGVPARPLRKRLDEETIRKLKESRWWEHRPEEVHSMHLHNEI